VLSLPCIAVLNDVHPISDNGFYATNFFETDPAEWMNLLETYGRQSWASTVFCGREDEQSPWNCKFVLQGMSMANGVSGTNDNSHIFVVETTSSQVGVYQRNQKTNDLVLVRTVPTNSACDNIDIAPDGSASMGCHPKLLSFVVYSKDPFRRHAPSQVLIWKDPVNDTEFTEMLYHNGELFSGSSFAARIGDLTIIGGVYHPGVLLCDSSAESYESSLPDQY
jgi:Arylesterase